MKIPKAVFEDFLKKASIGGEVESAMLTFDEKGISCLTNSKDAIKLCDTNIAVKAIANYKAIGKVGVRNINDLKKAVGRFKEKVDFNLKGNYILMSEGTKQIELAVCDEKYVKQPMSLELGFEHTIELDVAQLKDVDSDVGALTKADMFVSALGKDLIFTVDSGVDKIKQVIKTNHDFGTVQMNVKIDPKMFAPIVSSLTASKVNFSIRDNYPIQIREVSGDVTSIFIVAPRIEDEGGEKVAEQVGDIPAMEE